MRKRAESTNEWTELTLTALQPPNKWSSSFLSCTLRYFEVVSYFSSFSVDLSRLKRPPHRLSCDHSCIFFSLNSCIKTHRFRSQSSPSLCCWKRVNRYSNRKSRREQEWLQLKLSTWVPTSLFWCHHHIIMSFVSLHDNKLSNCVVESMKVLLDCVSEQLHWISKQREEMTVSLLSLSGNLTTKYGSICIDKKVRLVFYDKGKERDVRTFARFSERMLFASRVCISWSRDQFR